MSIFTPSVTATTADALWREYNASDFDEYRSYIARRLLAIASSDAAAVPALMYALNLEQDPGVRIRIIRFLAARESLPVAVALAKALFDSEVRVRAAAAKALAEFTEQGILECALPALVQSLSDPATQYYAEKAVRTAFGSSHVLINASERARLGRGETPAEIWPQRFAITPDHLAPPT